jgi:Protein of unknown function (DUF3634)
LAKPAILMLLSLRYHIIKIFSSPVFIFSVKEYKLLAKDGRLRNSFAFDCIDILKQANIPQAIIYAAKGKYGMPVVMASLEIPKEVLQEIRNIYMM